MLWLFGEIWLWLLLAFVLGAALAVAALSAARRRTGDTSEPGPAGKEEPPTTHIPRVSDAERTQRIQRTEPQLHFGERPSPRPRPSPSPRSTPEPAQSHSTVEDGPDEGRRQGILPVPPSEWHVRNEWPDERDIAVAEEDRPRRETDGRG